MLTLCKRHPTPFYQLFISLPQQTTSNFLLIHMPFKDKKARTSTALGGNKMRNQCPNDIKRRSLSAGLPWDRWGGPEPARIYPQRLGAGPALDQNNKDSLWQSWGAAVREEWNQMWHFSFICKCLLGGTLTWNDSWALTKLRAADGRIEGSWQRL